jgi:hypothetical protein
MGTEQALAPTAAEEDKPMNRVSGSKGQILILSGLSFRSSALPLLNPGQRCRRAVSPTGVGLFVYRSKSTFDS